MSRTRIVKGSITKITGGNHNICSRESSVNYIAGGRVTFNGEKEGILYTNNPVFPDELFINNIAIAMVYFRPNSTWNGEFGFDWLREKDNNLALTDDPAYADIIEGGYGNGSTDLTGGSTGTAYTKLKTEYTKIPIIRKPLEEGASVPTETPSTEYFVPYLTLFSKEFVDTLPETVINKPKYEAELKVLVEIEDDIDKLEFDLSTINTDADNPLITIDKVTLEHNTKTEGLVNATDATIKITCHKDLDRDKSINIYAYPKDSSTKPLAQQLAERKLAGRITILKNNAEERKEIKFVLVNVKTNITDTPLRDSNGTFTTQDKINLYNSFHQALVLPKIEISPTVLDLSTNVDFQVRTIEGVPQYGKFIYSPTDEANDRARGRRSGTVGAIYEDRTDFFTTIKTLFFNERDVTGNLVNSRYQTMYFTAFAMEVKVYDGAFGQIERVGIKNLVLFNNTRKTTTMIHEGLHGLNLYHTHKDGNNVISEPNRKYTYANGNETPSNATDNIMSYSDNRKSIWNWQRLILRRNI
ncbi:zinc metalloprotease [Empedobacter sedimenti]|uniref:hypothetical protein n=1 Tax=Empedobacter sedimenti TaxID=3042610 RepID=UPI0024A6A6D8|nr:hypothetical protein [Empedobacter sedimenti]